MNDNNSTRIENWFYALWTYNSGFHPQGSTTTGDWGLGWVNNPANPRLDPNRGTFLDPATSGGPVDAATPQRWPYQEKVIGFAAQSIGKTAFTWRNPDGTTTTTPEGAGFRPAFWNGDSTTAPVNRSTSKPARGFFCTPADNECSFDGAGKGVCASRDAAGAPDFQCWLHKSVTWKATCTDTCGRDFIRFNTTYTEPGDGVPAYPPACSLTGLPSGARVVDDVPSTFATAYPGCSRGWTNAGTFGFQFGTAGGGLYPSKVDTHQVGGGLNGHFWFAHTRDANSLRANRQLEVKGTWTFSSTLNQWGRVMVHLPDHGADTQQAAYDINLGNGKVKRRVLPQRIGRNGWADLGVFQFAGTPKITLSNSTVTVSSGYAEGQGMVDVAWDAVAIVPLAAKPKAFVTVLGDSYTSGEGAGSYVPETNVDGKTMGTAKNTRNACHRSRQAWARKGTLKDKPSETLGFRADNLDPTVDFHFIACSGGVTTDLYSTTQYGTLPQLDQGYLDENTTLVTLSIGGNDARFGDIIKLCENPVSGNCFDKALDPSIDPTPLALTEPELIRNQVRPAIQNALTRIHAKAPNAKILLMGYPVLVNFKNGCTLDLVQAEINWISGQVDIMAEQMALAARNVIPTGVPVTYADPRKAFENKGACGNPEWVNREVITTTAGDTGPPSAESFHPNPAGTLGYANVFIAELTKLGM